MPTRKFQKYQILLFLTISLFFGIILIIAIDFTSTTPAPATQPKSSAATIYPSQIIDLTNWKLTLPIGESEKPTEIKQPDLANFEIDPWFVSLPNGTGVRFRSPVNGITTKGSDYPRSELREMTNSGTANASWKSTSGTHIMFVDQAIASLPQKKKQIVAGQIHDAKDDVIVIRLQERRLFVNVDGENVKTLDENYVLGKRFNIKFVVNNGQTKIYYNGSPSPAYTLNKDYSDAYFKAGSYTQSNCSIEDSSKCNDTNYGEVIIYEITVTHS